MKIKLKSFKEKFKDKSKDKILEEMYGILLEKEKLENELKKYKNAHTPSSANAHIQINTQKSKDKKPTKVGRKKGKKSDHKGKTRAPEIPTYFVDVKTETNPKTGNKNREL